MECSKRKRRPLVVLHTVLILDALICVIPLIFVIIISLSSQESIRTIGYSFIPASWSGDAYSYLASMGGQLLRAYWNSFVVTVLGTLFSLALTVPYAYAISRRDFAFRKLFVFVCVFPMLFSGGLAPTYVMVRSVLGLKDSYAAMIIPALMNTFNIIIMRGFFQTSIPGELLEASAIDGCGEWRTFFKIVLPLSRPGIATVGLLTAIAYWNEWFIPMLYVRDQSHYPLPLLLMQIQNQADFLARNSDILGSEAVNAVANLPTDSLRMALVVLCVVPIMLVYPLLQRFIVGGLTAGSVKE